MSTSTKKTILNIELHYAEVDDSATPSSIIKESFYRFVKHQLALHDELNSPQQMDKL